VLKQIVYNANNFHREFNIYLKEQNLWISYKEKI